MARSSSLPTAKPLSGITRVIRSRTRSITVDRPTKTTNEFDEQTETISEITQDIWLFQPRENVGQEFAGERISGSLGGLVVADDTADIGHNDRLTHGGVEYEVDTVVGHPEDDDADGTASPNTDFFVVEFTRRQ